MAIIVFLNYAIKMENIYFLKIDIVSLNYSFNEIKKLYLSLWHLVKPLCYRFGGKKRKLHGVLTVGFDFLVRMKSQEYSSCF